MTDVAGDAPALPLAPIVGPDDPTPPAAAPVGGVVRLADAVALALDRSPALQAFAWRHRAAVAEVTQAGLRPNPQLDVAIENVTGSGAYRRGRQIQSTVLLSQVAELGGKRAARVRRAALGEDLAAWDYEAARLDVLERVVLAFVDVAAAQARVTVALDATTVAEDVVQAATARVAAASASPAELDRARAARAVVEVECVAARQGLAASRARLAATWGDAAASFERVDGDLTTLTPPPSLHSLQARLNDNPDLARWATEIGARHAARAAERANAVPNLTAGVGGRRYAATDDGAMVVEISLPLPLWNRNEGGIAAAEARMLEAEASQRRVRVDLGERLAQAHGSLAQAYAWATSLRDAVIPASGAAFRTIAAGYREGRFGYLEVLDVQRALVTARLQQVDALASYHRAMAAVERLVGGDGSRDETVEESR